VALKPELVIEKISI